LQHVFCVKTLGLLSAMLRPLL